MGLNGIKFTARVIEREIALRNRVLDLRTMVSDYTPLVEGEEESIKIPTITPGDVVAMPTTDAAFANTDTINTQKTLTLNKDFGKPFIVAASAQAETPVKLQEIYAFNAEEAHRSNRNKQILAELADAANTASYDFKYADTTDNVISEEDIATAAAILDDAKAPQDGRYMAVRASDYKDLFKIASFISRDKMGQNGEAIPKYIIGEVYGFTVVKAPSSEMPYLNTSTGAVAASGKKCAIFWQQFAGMYAGQIYQLGGPEYKAAGDEEWYNLHHKFGADEQVPTFAVTYREN